ncbi:N-acetyl-gamma-glutamyl-phosphate reductase [mine drainage metagenome]|uniref:N-acetyl-gamma-glutamyl-phosphate reductase n=1 Tax=mine drainage metagenome TaxID=410659 RepID=T1BIS7_9ZZZZ
MTVPVVILGAASFGGGELLRLLELHEGVKVTYMVSRSRKGACWSDVHPNLWNRARVERFVDRVDWQTLADHDRIVVFSALRHGELAAQYSELETGWRAAGILERILLIDLSADFRLERANCGFVYGLSEWMADDLRQARRIANPGCFATALALGMLPLVRHLDPDHLATFGLTGSSGAGLTPTDRTHHPFRAHNFQPYQPFRHRHAAEVDRMLVRHARPADWSFIPYSASWVRGIHVTIETCLPRPLADGELTRIYEGSYPRSPFVHWVGELPGLLSVVGSNHCLIGGAVHGRHVAVFVVLDNLVKGMAGQAVQNLNLALGWPEDRGLERLMGPYPI